MTHSIPTMPYSQDAEEGVIGSLLLDAQSDNAQKALAFLKPESFHSGPCREIFSVLKDMSTHRKAIDGLTVNDELENRGLLQQVGGFSYLAQIAKNTPTAANVVGYANVVRDKATERFALRQANQITALFYERNGMSAAEKLEVAQRLITEAMDYAQTGNRKGLRRIDEVADRWISAIEARWNNPEAHRGLSTGIPDLDKLLYPKFIVKGSLFVIGARPKMGKTTVMTEMALHVGDVAKLPVAMFSLEMPEEQIFGRMVGQQAHVNTDMFYQGAKNQEDWKKVYAAVERMRNHRRIWLDDQPGMTLAHIQAECRKLKRREGKIGMIGVDYLTLMTTDKADTNSLAFGNITKALKNLAKELDTVVVLLIQLNRNLEERANKRPMPSDSRKSGQIEQDCDYWLGIYKERVYDDRADETLTELILRLNRHGKTGTVYVDQRDAEIYPCDQQEAERRAGKSANRKPLKEVMGF